MCKKSFCCYEQGQAVTLWDGMSSYFMHPIKTLESVDIKKCDYCGKAYRLSWIQYLGCFILSIIWIVFDTICYMIAGILGEIFAFLLYPLVMEIPRRYLPWKEVDNFYYQRWSSRLRLILANILGLAAGVMILT